MKDRNSGDMKWIFYPRSIAVIGVSSAANNLARNIIGNLQEYGFKGPIYAVGRSGGEALGLPILPDVASIPGDIDFAAILTPARTVEGFMRECMARGARGFWIGSGGFAELDEEGAGLQDRLVRLAAEGGARFAGPNCFGIINTENGLCLPFGRLRRMPPGETSVLAQSGGVGISYLQELSEEGVGINKFVSLGNKADLDENDLLEYLGTDPGTGVICLYLESMSRGREFISAASRVTKPVLLHKTNIHPITRRIAMTHTASLAVDDAVLDAAVRSAGVVRIGTVREMVNTTKIFRLPVLKGPRLAILSRSGGHAVIASDECARLGFTLPPLPKEFLEKARSKMRSGVVGLGNPLDLGDLYDLPFYSEMLDTICSLDTIDGVVVLFTYITSMGHDVPLEILKKAGKLSRKYDKPVAFCLISWGDVTRHARDGSGFPVFTTPEDALTALKHSLEHHNGQRGKGGPAAAPAPGSCADAASIISACRGRGEKMISYDALRVLKSAGIDAVATYLAHDADEVRSVAASIPTPLVMKIASPDVAHKSDAGGVATGITGPQEAVSQALEMGDRVAARVPGARIDGFILQETAPEGVEVFIGAGRDPSFGPFVTVGLGGVFVEVLRDTATGLAPLDAAGALKLIESLKGAPLLKGARGRPPCDLDALCSAIVKVSNLIACVPEISGIDINPAVAYPRGLGLLAVDARMTLEAP